MAEYIDKQELIKSIMNTPLSWDYPVTPDYLTGAAKRQTEIFTLIKDMPGEHPVDEIPVEERKKIKWEIDVLDGLPGTRTMALRCPCCYMLSVVATAYCPHCGADMRG